MGIFHLPQAAPAIMQEHPFAPITRALGQGKDGSRTLTQGAGRCAMAQGFSQKHFSAFSH